MQPADVSAVDVAFPTNVEHLMPSYKEIPAEYKSGSNAWNRLVSTWFYKGIDATLLVTKPDVDRAKAFRHLKAIMGSWEPKHEHKIAGVAYLMSQWFESPTKAESK